MDFTQKQLTQNQKPGLWHWAAYYAGKGSLFRKGVTYRHLRYVADVKRFKDEFDEKFKN